MPLRYTASRTCVGGCSKQQLVGFHGLSEPQVAQFLHKPTTIRLNL